VVLCLGSVMRPYNTSQCGRYNCVLVPFNPHFQSIPEVEFSHKELLLASLKGRRTSVINV
jgi:hypothetical protein